MASSQLNPDPSSNTERGKNKSQLADKIPPLQNIGADLHSHSKFSDGLDLISLTKVAHELGLDTVAIADHVRQRWDDVKFYNLDAYTITTGLDAWEENWLLSENMELLADVIETRKQDFEEELEHDLDYNFEQDYESWNEGIIEDFLDQHQPSLVPLSSHYIPLKEWDKAKYFRLDDFDDLTDDQAARAAENYVNEYENLLDFGEYIGEKYGIPIIATHADGPLRTEKLREFLYDKDRGESEILHSLLDIVEDRNVIIEFNARVLRKLSEEYEGLDGYDQEDAEWFGREILRRADNGDLNYIVSSDAHSAEGMVENLRMADEILDEYETPSMTYQEVLDSVPSPDETPQRLVEA